MSERTRDDETQRYDQEYTDEDFLDAIRECPVASTTNVADAIGCYRKTALRRLNELEERSEVASESVSGKAKVWYIPE